MKSHAGLLVSDWPIGFLHHRTETHRLMTPLCPCNSHSGGGGGVHVGVGVGDSERESESARFSLSVIPVLRGEMEDRFCKEDKGGKVLCFYHICSFLSSFLSLFFHSWADSQLISWLWDVLGPSPSLVRTVY